MDHKINRLKYSSSVSPLFADEIILGKAPIITKNFRNNSDIDFLQTHNNNTEKKPVKLNENSLLNFSLLSLFIIFAFFIISRITSFSLDSFNGNSASFFVFGYFVIFSISVFVITKRKMVSLEIKDGFLFIKSFPSLNKKIPINQLLRCELNTLKDGNFDYENRMNFSLHSNNNRYKQPLAAGVTLQMVDGRHIIIGSKKE